MREYDLRVNGKDYKVAVKALTTDRAQVVVNGDTYDVDIRRIRREHSTRPDNQPPPIAARALAAPAPSGPVASAGGAGTVNAPIPGAIMELFVKVGDTVKATQEVIKLEAMKMENVLLAPVDGTVKKIHVKAGDTVAQGQVLIEIG